MSDVICGTLGCLSEAHRTLSSSSLLCPLFLLHAFSGRVSKTQLANSTGAGAPSGGIRVSFPTIVDCYLKVIWQWIFSLDFSVVDQIALEHRTIDILYRRYRGAVFPANNLDRFGSQRDVAKPISIQVRLRP